MSALVAGKPALRASLADINSTRRINAVVLNGRYLVVPGSTSF